MTKIDEYNRLKREEQEDARLVAAVDEWFAAALKTRIEPIACGNRALLCEQMEALEGELVHFSPTSMAGIKKMLDVVLYVLQVRDAYPETWHMNCPASVILARCVEALSGSCGAIPSPDFNCYPDDGQEARAGQGGQS